MGTPTAFVYGEQLQANNPGDDRERPLRRRLGIELIRAYGLLDDPDVIGVDPRPASSEEIAAVHAPAYIRAVRRYAADPDLAATWEAAQWGLQKGGDTPARPGMHEAAAAVCGASLTGARLIASGRVDQAFVPGGGLHHALANRASGFCVYNDCALAIRALLDAGAERVAFVDVDAHHGDGVQWIFYDDPRVLTCSVHEKVYGFFPGTGGLEERGGPAAPGSALNVPLPPYSGDGPYLAAVDVIATAVRRFRPDVVVTDHGGDPHHADPLAHLAVTMPAFRSLYRALRDMAFDAAGGRWLVLSGGSYNVDVLPRLWAMQVAAMLDVELDDDLPEPWRALAAEWTGRDDLTAALTGDGPADLDAETARRADETAYRTVDQARALVDDV